MRENFNAKRSLPPLGDEAKAGIAHAKEVATILRRNIVQGEKFGNEEGRGERYRE